MSPKKNARAEFIGIHDSDLLNELSKLKSRHRDIDRVLSDAATRGTIAADVELASKKAADNLLSIATEGTRSARASFPGTPAWRKVEEMVTAYVLTSPEFSQAMVQVLGDHLPSEADLAPQRAEMADIEQRIATINAVQDARREDRDREYLDNAFASRSMG
jgi:hypothetical protein